MLVHPPSLAPQRPSALCPLITRTAGVEYRTSPRASTDYRSSDKGYSTSLTA